MAGTCFGKNMLKVLESGGATQVEIMLLMGRTTAGDKQVQSYHDIENLDEFDGRGYYRQTKFLNLVQSHTFRVEWLALHPGSGLVEGVLYCWKDMPLVYATFAGDHQPDGSDWTLEAKDGIIQFDTSAWTTNEKTPCAPSHLGDEEGRDDGAGGSRLCKDCKWSVQDQYLGIGGPTSYECSNGIICETSRVDGSIIKQNCAYLRGNGGYVDCPQWEKK